MIRHFRSTLESLRISFYGLHTEQAVYPSLIASSREMAILEL